MTYSAYNRRNDAITLIVNTYIGQDGDEAGQLIAEAHFGNLYDSVRALRNMGRTAEWQYGVEKWLMCIEQAIVTFNDSWGRPKGAVIDANDFLSYREDGRDLTRLFKWAVQQGGIYAALYNR